MKLKKNLNQTTIKHVQLTGALEDHNYITFRSKTTHIRYKQNKLNLATQMMMMMMIGMTESKAFYVNMHHNQL